LAAVALVARTEGAILLTGDSTLCKAAQASDVKVVECFGCWMNLWRPRGCFPRKQRKRLN
jgi:hypothetical protein